MTPAAAQDSPSVTSPQLSEESRGKNPRSTRIAIVGAGPVGVEAALYAKALGYAPRVYESGEAGHNLSRWGFVRLFSPWKLDVSPLGLAELKRRGLCPGSSEACPTGDEFLQQYVRPLAESLQDSLVTGAEVLAISRLGLLKGDNVAGKRRTRAPFRLLIRRGGGEEEATADMVLDASGVYHSPCFLGDGGIPAVGEMALRREIRYGLVDVLGAEREAFAGRKVLLVGSGCAAASMLSSLISLHEKAPSTAVFWARRSSGPDPFPLYQGDPFAERARIAREGNRLAAEPPPSLTVLPGVAVRAVHKTSCFHVELRPVDGGGMPQVLEVDRIVACVGHRPSIEMYRELQVHQCFATEGPMGVASAILQAGGRGDGLSLPQGDVRNPEPGFFILGRKSFGRRSDFLLAVGRAQVRDAFCRIEEDPELDLYREAPPAG
jgi:hypothetical protein